MHGWKRTGEEMAHILLVDDEILTLQAIELHIDWQRCGIDRVHTCSSAMKARETFLEDPEIRLVISDIEMPGMDGLEFVSWIRSVNPHIPVLFLTGYADFEYARTAISLRVNDYILKPLDYEELEEKIITLMKQDVPDQKNEVQKEHPVIAEVKKYIGENLSRNFTRRELAEHISLNESYLSRLFHRETGCSIKEYIQAERIRKAKHLLSTTAYSITMVGELAGYESTAYFIKVFKKETGQTPGEFRKA